MGDDKLRVSIHTAIEEKALIPFPVGDEIKTVKQAMGSWVMWPKNLIIYNENKVYIYLHIQYYFTYKSLWWLSYMLLIVLFIDVEKGEW